VAVELDHVIVFVAGREAAERLFPGFVLEAGIRHVGQGTRNRRVVFARNYVEAVWVDPEVGRRGGPGGAARYAPGAACPFGVVLRGTVFERDRERYVPYQVPAGGPALLLLEASLRDASQPFVAVREDGGAPAWPEIPQHPNGVRGVRTALICSPTVPDLGATCPRDVRFRLGRPRLRLEWEGPAEPWELPGRLPDAAC
jgi:hypothetical protein